MLQLYCSIFTLNYFVWSHRIVWFWHCYHLVLQSWKPWNRQRLIMLLFFLTLFHFELVLLHPKILSSSRELEPFSGLKLFLQLNHRILQLLKNFFVKLPIVRHENVVDFEVVLLESVIRLMKFLVWGLLGFVFGKKFLKFLCNAEMYIFAFIWKIFEWITCLRADYF